MMELASIPGANVPLSTNLEAIDVKEVEIGGKVCQAIVGLTLQDAEGRKTGAAVLDIREAVVAAGSDLLKARQEVTRLGQRVPALTQEQEKLDALMDEIRQKNAEIREIEDRLHAALKTVSGVKLYRKDYNFQVVIGDTYFKLAEGQRARMTLSVLEIPISDKIRNNAEASIVGRTGIVKALIDLNNRVVRFAAIHGETFSKGDNQMKTAGGRVTVAVVCDYSGTTQIIRAAANKDALVVNRNVYYEPPAKVVSKPAEEESVGSADDGRTFRDHLGQKKSELEVKAAMDAVREAIGKLAPEQRAALAKELAPPAEKKPREKKPPKAAPANKTKAVIPAQPETIPNVGLVEAPETAVPVPAAEGESAEDKLQALIGKAGS